MKQKLTKRSVEALPLGAVCWDTDLRGFGVRIRNTGRDYVLKRRIKGKQRWLTIGRHGEITTEEARRQAVALSGDIAKGEDPTENTEDSKGALTVSELCDIYLREGCAAKKQSTILTDKGRIERHIKVLLGNLLVRELRAEDVKKFLGDVAAGKTATNVKTGLRGRAIVTGGNGTASRTVGLLGGILSFAVEQKYVVVNPVKGVKRFKDRKVERYLTSEEQSRLGDSLTVLERTGKINTFAAAAIRLLLLTGARRGEILSLQWSYVDLERGFLFLPDSKGGQKPIPLSNHAKSVLESVPRIVDNPYVFCGRVSGKHIVDLKRPWNTLCEHAAIVKFRKHDMRHNLASVGIAAGLSLAVIGKILGHKRTETTARYAHLADNALQAANELVSQRVIQGMRRKLPGKRKRSVIK